MSFQSKQFWFFIGVFSFILFVLFWVGIDITKRPSPPKEIGATIYGAIKPLYLPDPVLTPGAIDFRVTQANINQTICRAGYTKKVRPPTSWTSKMERESIKQYGYADTDPSHYEYDHLISLELGGAPKDTKNLWPEPYDIPSLGASAKDKIENFLHKEVCAGKITLKEARNCIAKDWTKCDHRN